jgi:hypothetical protein
LKFCIDIPTTVILCPRYPINLISTRKGEL